MYLTPFSLNRLNSSLKFEFGLTATLPEMSVDHHLPCRGKDCGGSLTLPVCDVEGAVHIFDTAFALHDEWWFLHPASVYPFEFEVEVIGGG